MEQWLNARAQQFEWSQEHAAPDGLAQYQERLDALMAAIDELGAGIRSCACDASSLVPEDHDPTCRYRRAVTALTTTRNPMRHGRRSVVEACQGRS